MERLRSTRGFTLIELLIAVLIIGILAAIALPAFNEQRARAKDRKALNHLEYGVRAAKAIHAEGETFPADSNALTSLLSRAERSTSFVAGATFPTDQVAAERLSAQRVVLRNTSGSGKEFMMELDEDTNRVHRFGTDPKRTAATMPAITNLVTNSSFENATPTATWIAYGGGTTLSTQRSWSAYGRQSVRVQGTFVTAAGYQGFGIQTGYTLMAVTPGQQYTASFRLNVRETGAQGLAPMISWHDSGGTQTTPSGTWATSTSTRRGEYSLHLTGTAPAAATQARVVIVSDTSNYSGPNAPVDFDVDAASFVASSQPLGYTDGSTPGGTFSGAAHASASTGPALWLP